MVALDRDLVTRPSFQSIAAEGLASVQGFQGSIQRQTAGDASIKMTLFRSVCLKPASINHHLYRQASNMTASKIRQYDSCFTIKGCVSTTIISNLILLIIWGINFSY